MTGRARGRSRGRARGSAVEKEEVRRPGGPAATAPPVSTPAPPQDDPKPPGVVPGSGRASHRGGAHAEQRPGDAAAEAPPCEQMSAMSMGGAGEGRRRRDDFDFNEPRTRPQHIVDKTGKSGKPIKLLTNYFKLLMAPDYHLYQYHVKFSPDVQNKNMRKRLVKDLRDILGTARAFDGMVLFLNRRLQKTELELHSKIPSDQTDVRITFQLTNELPPSSPTCLHVYNIIFRRLLHMLDMKQIGRHYYSPTLAVQVPKYKLEVWPGFVTSIAQYENSIMLMADISHKILRMDTVLDIMYDIHRSRQQDFHGSCEKRLIGEIVLTRYNNKTYRIDDIDWAQNPRSTFKGFDGSETTFVDYYKSKHSITVIDMDQPLLLSKPKASDIRRGMDGPILLLPEQCTLTGLSDDARSDFGLMKDIGTHTRIAPSGRMKTLNDFIGRINTQDDVKEHMIGWGLQFDKELLNIKGRVLPPEEMMQAGRHYSSGQADWSREMRGKKMHKCVDLQHWVMLFAKRDSAVASDFFKTLCEVSTPMGIHVEKPDICELPDDRSQTYLDCLSQVVKSQTQMVICILPTNRKDRYDAIKKFCCIRHPVPSQVIVSRTIQKKQMLMSVATKIAIQLNCKLGGEAWTVEIPIKKLMVVGIDSYHDSAKKGRSVGAFVASMNANLTSYYSRCTFQHNMQELMDSLVICMNASLKKFHEVNGCLPEKIIIYRDGVGDGQLAAVVDSELPQILNCFKKHGHDYNPSLAFIVVKKRINSRFFAQMGGKLDNPPPGTIIDTEVTRPEWYDFYLISQSVRQGTVTPTSYNIVHDTTTFKADHIQRLTYKLCHLYYNWPGTIRVPAPCQYAHKLAFLVGQSLHQDPHIDLADKLYFL